MKQLYNRGVLLAVAALTGSFMLTTTVAQIPVRITNGGSMGSAPNEFAIHNGRLYFSAKSAADGPEIYSTDGTPEGTSLLKNINTTVGSGSDPKEFTVYHDRLFFSAATGAAGRELWVTNGTAEGTTLVRDINPGSNSSDPAELTVSNGRLYFVAQNGPQRELWSSDGTSGGTQRLSDELGISTGGATPTELTASDNKLFYRFVGRNNLWVTDGTAAGTRFLKGGPLNPLNPDGPPAFISLGNFIPLGNKIVFRANAPGTEDEPWVSDGTPEGTFSLDVTPGPNASFPQIFGSSPIYNGRVYFLATQKIGSDPPRTGLFATDGTMAGTQFIKNIPTAYEFEVFDGKLYFFSGVFPQVDRLWVTDGTEAGTQLVKDLTPAPGPDPISPARLTVAGNRLYFIASESFYGRELWSSDGTPTGTVRLADYNFNAETILRAANDLTSFNDKLFFTARTTLPNDRELWRLDNINLPPVAPVAGIPNVSGTVGVSFFQVIPSFTDPEALPLSYTVTGLPANLLFSGGSGGIVAGTPIVAGVFPTTVSVRDRSGNVTSLTYTITINPAIGSLALQLLAPTYSCATGAITFNTSGGNGSPVLFNAPGIQRSSLSAVSGTVEDGLRNDPKPIMLQATQSGTTVSFMFDLPGVCGGGPSPGSPFQLLAPDYNCATGAIMFKTSGGNGSPIEYAAAGITGWTSNPSQFVDQDSRTASDVQPFTLMARQNGLIVTYVWNLKATCGRARQGASQPESLLNITVLANPTTVGTVDVEIRGASGQPLHWAVTDAQGRPVSEEQIKQPGSLEKRTVPINQAPGLYFLRVSTSTQVSTTKIIRQ